MSDSSTFVPGRVLFSHFNHLDLTLLDCSMYRRFCGRNRYKLEFRVENHKNGYPHFLTKYINTRTEVKEVKNLQKMIGIPIGIEKKKIFIFYFLKKNV